MRRVTIAAVALLAGGVACEYDVNVGSEPDAGCVGSGCGT